MLNLQRSRGDLGRRGAVPVHQDHQWNRKRPVLTACVGPLNVAVAITELEVLSVVNELADDVVGSRDVAARIVTKVENDSLDPLELGPQHVVEFRRSVASELIDAHVEDLVADD